jgi:hypothetical protein
MKANVQDCAVDLAAGVSDDAGREAAVLVRGGALGGTRTPNLLIRSQMLYPLSYERTNQQYTAV